MGQSVVDNTSMQCYLTKVVLDALNAHSCNEAVCFTNQQLLFVCIQPLDLLWDEL